MHISEANNNNAANALSHFQITNFQLTSLAKQVLDPIPARSSLSFTNASHYHEVSTST